MSKATKLTVGRVVDWGFAATVGARLARPGPAGHRLHPAPGRSSELAERALTRRDAGSRRHRAEPDGGRWPTPGSSIGREWIRAAAESMRAMTGGGGQAAAASCTGRITGAQTGAVLAFVSSGILGQYDPFGDNGGELLLVYPNVIAVERQLRVLPADFRLWVSNT